MFWTIFEIYLSNFVRIRLLETDLKTQRDDEAIVAFRNFANGPNNNMFKKGAVRSACVSDVKKHKYLLTIDDLTA